MTMTGCALEGIRVLDLTRHQAGPFCCMLLADMGAEVIKIEAMKGDEGRRHPSAVNGENLYFAAWNRNKKGIRLNLYTDRGKDLLARLVRKSDVLVENFQPGVMKEIGFDYPRVQQLNPRLVMTSISGFGQYGPYSQRPAFDAVIQAMSGLLSVTGFPDREPVKVGVGIGDYAGGFYGALGTMFALYRRTVSGKGQHVDISMLDATVSLNMYFLGLYGATGEVAGRHGNRSSHTHPHNVYPTKDGYVYISCGQDHHWLRLLKAMGREGLAEDPRFGTLGSRRKYADDLDPMISEWTRTLTSAEIQRVLDAVDVPCGPVNTIAEVYNDPHLRERGMVVHLDHHSGARLAVPGSVFKLSETPGRVRTPAPGLGQHSGEVFRSVLGLTEQELAEMEREGVV